MRRLTLQLPSRQGQAPLRGAARLRGCPMASSGAGASCATARASVHPRRSPGRHTRHARRKRPGSPCWLGQTGDRGPRDRRDQLQPRMLPRCRWLGKSAESKHSPQRAQSSPAVPFRPASVREHAALSRCSVVPLERCRVVRIMPADRARPRSPGRGAASCRPHRANVSGTGPWALLGRGSRWALGPFGVSPAPRPQRGRNVDAVGHPGHSRADMAPVRREDV